MSKKEYAVTPRAGDWVAGVRVPENGRLSLTDRQAAHELRLGNIELVTEKPAPRSTRRAPRAK